MDREIPRRPSGERRSRRWLDHAVQRLIDRLTFGAILVAGERVWINATVGALVGRSTSSVRSLDTWFSLVWGARAGEVRAIYDRDRAAGFPRTAVVALPAGAGFRSVAFSASRLFGGLELWVLADVTEETQATERFRMLFEHSRDGHILNAESGVLDCNQAAADLLGYPSREALIGVHLRQLSPERQPDGRTSVEKGLEMEARARADGFHRFDWIHLRADGQPIPVEVVLTPVLLPSGPAILAVWHDLRERYEREAALEAAKEAAEASLEVRKRFLATMSHELRTPMNAVLGLTEALLDEPGLPAEHRQLVETIQGSGQSLRRLLDDILDYSKLEAAEVRLEHAPFSASALVGDILRLHEGSARARGVRLKAFFDPALPPQVMGDPTRVRQVLANLVSNAVKFSPNGLVAVDAGWEASGLVLRVVDSGVGMGPEALAQIFIPFRQADATTTRRFGGTGLGLAIVKRLVEAMEGRVAVRSAPGRGATFEVVLPLPPAPPSELRRETVDRPALGHDGERPLRVVVAEDDRVNRLVLERMLARAPVDLWFVEDGAQVGRAVAERNPDLVLMDVHMPEVDGLEATRRLRAAGFRLPILALTASALDEERSACIEAGMDGVLSKPIDRATMLEALAGFRRRPPPRG